MPIVDKYRDMGTMVMGKSESGLVQIGDVLQVNCQCIAGLHYRPMNLMVLEQPLIQYCVTDCASAEVPAVSNTSLTR